MKVVLDTNVLISGLMYPRSIPGRIVMAWLDGRYDLVLSIEQLSEVGRVLHYPKIRKILKWDRPTIELFLKQLYLRSLTVDITGIEAEVPGDASDSVILATALGAQADYLVTGDADLLALREHHTILAPSEFIRLL